MASSSTPRTAMRSPLVQQLLNTRGQGIAVFVQQRVHSTSVGLAASQVFVQELLDEVESAIIAFLPVDNDGSAQLSEDQEVELGTLISASSLTIRYVTEREAMVGRIDRFRAAFLTLLHYPRWTKAFLGLKMVSLMGCTRLLESFSTHIPETEVVADLRWLFTAFLEALVLKGEPDKASVHRINYLFRPACELLTVALQSHPKCHEVVYSEVFPMLCKFVHTFDDNVSDPVKTDLASTIAVLLEMQLVVPRKSAFALLDMPRFAVDDDSTDQEENVHLEQDGSMSTSLLLGGIDNVAACCDGLVRWLHHKGRRQGAVVVIPLLCAVMTTPILVGCRRTLAQGLLHSLHELELANAADFEFYLGSVEALRDLGLRDGAFPSDLVDELYSTLRAVMPRLHAGLKALDVDRAQQRQVKATCSSVREALVEAFIWWIHYSGAGVFERYREDFVSSVVEKLADPRIYGDILHVAQLSLDAAAFQTAVETAITPLYRAIGQLDRYSKVAATRIINGVARIATAAHTAIVPFANGIVTPLLDTLIDGTCKGKSLRLRMNAIACITLSCSEEPTFSLESNNWVQQFIEYLLDAGADHDVHALNVLNSIVRADVRIRGQVVNACVVAQDVVGHIVQSSLTSWPIYAEDMDTVLLVLAILSCLLEEEQLKSTVDVSRLTESVSRLVENAEHDEQQEIVDAGKELLVVLIPQPYMH